MPDHIASPATMTVLQPLRLLAAARRGAAFAAMAVSVAGCSNFGAGWFDGGFLTPYRAEVVQGNFVSREQVALLRVGMDRATVRDILGTPLVTSLFHGDRWDYVFTMRRQGVDPQAYRLVLIFKGDALERFDGDEMPTEEEFVARLDVRKRPGKVPALEATEDELTRWAAPARNETTGAAAEVAPPPVSYPPLESPR